MNEKIYIEKGQSAVFRTSTGEEIEVSLEMITPEFAKEVLETKNAGNREVNKAKVKQYAEDMKEGRWRVNGETCGFYEDDSIASAQHRFMACEMAGVPFETLVVRGIKKDYADTIDQGDPRKINDYFHYKGIGNSKLVSDAAMKVMRLCAGRKDTIGRQSGGKAVSCTPEKVYSTYLKNKEIYDEAAEFVKKIPAAGFKQISKRDMCGLISYLRIVGEFEKEFVEEFFYQLSSIGRENRVYNSAVYALYQRFNLSNNTTDLGRKLSQLAKHCIFCKAWRYYVAGIDTTIDKLRIDGRKEHDIKLV